MERFDMGYLSGNHETQDNITFQINISKKSQIFMVVASWLENRKC